MMHMLVIDGAVGDAEVLYADLRRAVALLDASNKGNWRLWIVAYGDGTNSALDDNIGRNAGGAIQTIDAQDPRRLPSGDDRRLLRRSSMHTLEAASRPAERRPAQMRAGSIDIDCSTGQCWRDGVEVHLSAREFGMLEHLLRSNGAVVSTFDLMMLGQVGADPRTDHFDADMYRLRHKLQASDGWPAIHRVRGGYQILAS